MITIIPAIDLIGGKCVRLSRGDFSKQTPYPDDPLTMAQRFEAAGLERLHLVDLDGARTGKITNLDVLEKIAKHTNLRIDFSGGIKTDDEIRQVLDAGASWISIGSMAVKDPATVRSWLERFGTGHILLGADVKEERVVINGWQEQTALHVFDFIAAYYDLGLRQVFCTDITMDGMLEGPSVALYRKITARFPGIFLIASGGVAGSADLDLLEQAGCKGVIIGKAIYEGLLSPGELGQRMLKRDES